MIFQRITQKDYIEAANKLGCDVNILKSLAYIEGRGMAFFTSGDPILLYEPYVFGRLTKHKFSDKKVIIAGREYPLSLEGTWDKKKAMYVGGESEYIKFRAAVQLDRDATIKACSWGKFQILGMNHAIAGYETPQKFLEAMYKDEKEHLKAFVNFCSNTNIKKALRKKDFDEIARLYNGAGYKANNYHIKLKTFYESLSTGKIR